MTTLIISNKATNDIIKVAESLGESGLLIKDNSKTTKTEAKKQEDDMLLDRLGTSLLGNLVTGKTTIGTNEATIGASGVSGTIRAVKDF